MPQSVLAPADGHRVHTLECAQGLKDSRCVSMCLLQPLTAFSAAYRIHRQPALAGEPLRCLTWNPTAYTASCPRPTTRCADAVMVMP